MLNQRQADLLKLIVEDYIKTARPVSSNSLANIMDVSSATVRNEMAFLEENGLIEKTHISSGRIPSEKGYRYYVDNIMKPKELTGEDMLKLQTIFHNNNRCNRKYHKRYDKTCVLIQNLIKLFILPTHCQKKHCSNYHRKHADQTAWNLSV